MSSSQMDRELYFKLQNIEDHQDILPKAELELQNRLDTARQYLITEFKTPQLSSLVDEYSEELIVKWHDQSYFDVLEKYNNWLTIWESNGRKNEMLVSEEFTKWWLTQIAPTKLVDGSWLQNVASGKSMKDSRTLRPVLANLYLTFFEELGEGHLNRNHVTVYRETLETAGINLPLSTSRAFAESSALYDESFFVGTTQLLLGTFSDKYLPEIIGYNFGYEQLPLHLLISIQELKNLNIPSYYFELHVSIDNHDSGHARLALDTVKLYMKTLSHLSPSERHEIWTRILTGYCLNDIDKMKPIIDKRRNDCSSRLNMNNILPTEREQMVKLLISKAKYANGIHGKAVLSNCKLNEWFFRLVNTAGNDQRRIALDIMDGLVKDGWIVPGSPEKSVFLQDLCHFGGTMYRIFTDEEIKVIQNWINSFNSETVSGHGSTNENHEGNANGVVHTNLSKQNLAFMDVIRNKSGPSKAFHRKIKIRHPKSGEEKGLNEWMDDPAALLEILDLDLELRKKLHKSVATGKMKKYFNDSEQEVVRDWITQYNDIDIHSGICPRHHNSSSKNTPSRSYPLLRELSMMHVTDTECQQIFSNMMNCISNTPKTYGVVHDVSTIEKIITTAFLLPSCLDGIGGVQIHTSHLGTVLHNIKRLLVCSNGSSNNETANWWDLWEKVSKDHRYSLKRDTSSYRFEEELHRVIKSLTIRPIQYQYFIFGFFMHLFHQIRFVVLRAGFDSKNFIVERDEIMIMLENIRRTVINAIGKRNRDEVINVVDTGMGWLLAEHLYEMENISFFEE